MRKMILIENDFDTLYGFIDIQSMFRLGKRSAEPVETDIVSESRMHKAHLLNRRTFLRLAGNLMGMPLAAGCVREGNMDTFPAQNGLPVSQTPGTVPFEAALLQPTMLPAQAVDLTLRFQQFEPLFAPPGLLAAWPLNEGSGYVFRDLTGHGHDAYLLGTNWNTSDSGLTASLHGSGLRGSALRLNGTQWLQVQQAGLAPAEAWTLMLWLKLEQRGSQTLLAVGQNELALNVNAAGALELRLGEQTLATAANTLVPGAWQHVALVGEAAAGQVRLFVDGTLAVAQSRVAFQPWQADLCLGGAEGSEQSMRGLLGEATLHSIALSAEEIAHWRTIGLPIIYRQTRETIDAGKSRWTNWKGNAPIPHPFEADTLLTLRFNGALASDQGQMPQGGNALLVPGVFGAALVGNAGPLRYPSPIAAAQGTFEAWVVAEAPASANRQILFRAEGRTGWLELALANGHWEASLSNGSTTEASVQAPMAIETSALLHVALTWEATALTLFLNGVEVARTALPAGAVQVYNQTIQLSGAADNAFGGQIDDLRIGGEVRAWGSICPRGHGATAAASLDLRDFFAMGEGEPLRWWRAGSADGQWAYSGRGVQQANPAGVHLLFHPDAFGEMSSFEAGVRFDRPADGWAGVFVQASAPGEPLAGYSFSLNPQGGRMRIAAHQNGSVVAEKVLIYDFPIARESVYTLTLTSADDGILRGYIDGNSAISLNKADLPAFSAGFAGLFCENLAAHFSAAHFTALTPTDHESRLIEQRLFAPGQSIEAAGGYKAVTLIPFRWQKWHAHLPWRRGGMLPEPSGALFGPADDVIRPNKGAAWRSEDSANSDVIAVNGTIYYFMRGNPRIGNSHGPAAIGLHSTPAARFDGRHFRDHNGEVANVDEAQLLRGNRDTAPADMRDGGARSERFQVNDQGSCYIGEGRILLFAREFRNRVGANPWYRRLGYGIYDTAAQAWQQSEVRYVEWSRMPADRPGAPHEGYDATPEIVALREADDDRYTVFLLHHQTGTRIGAVSGLRLAQGEIVLDEGYPQRDSFVEDNGNIAYGERVLFDNGIYYLHYNAASDGAKMNRDWPDRLHLAASLHPYRQTFINSAANVNEEQPYFARGAVGDFDNGAIWQGCMFKHEGRYYLYYEAYHTINSVDTPYDAYDDIAAGSRAGYATAN
jgi:hypothetical protein